MARPSHDCGRLPRPCGARRERSGVRGYKLSRGPIPLTQPSPQPKSDVSDFGHVIKWPNSGKPEVGLGEEVPPCPQLESALTNEGLRRQEQTNAPRPRQRAVEH